MAETLGKSSVGVLEGELATLIAKNQIPARIDSEAHTLHRKVTNEREISLAKVCYYSESYCFHIPCGVLHNKETLNYFIILYNSNIIAHNHHTNNNPSSILHQLNSNSYPKSMNQRMRMQVMELGDTHTTCVRQGILRLSLMEHRFAVETSDWEERD